MTIGSSKNISIVIPVYNGASTLEKLTHELHTVLVRCASQFELIFVNDASPDESWQTISKLCTGHEWIRGIDLMRNVGQHNALLCGIRAAKYEIVVTVDDDLQNPPSQIPKLLEKFDEGFDVVYGFPEHERHSFLRTLASRITKLVLQNAMGADIAQKISAFRVLRTQLRFK